MQLSPAQVISLLCGTDHRSRTVLWAAAQGTAGCNLDDPAATPDWPAICCAAVDLCDAARPTVGAPARGLGSLLGEIVTQEDCTRHAQEEQALRRAIERLGRVLGQPMLGVEAWPA